MPEVANYNGGGHSEDEVLNLPCPRLMAGPWVGYTISLGLSFIFFKIMKLGWMHEFHTAFFGEPLQGDGETWWMGVEALSPTGTRVAPHIFYLGVPHKNMWKKGLCLLKEMFKNDISNFLPASPNPTCYKQELSHLIDWTTSLRSQKDLLQLEFYFLIEGERGWVSESRV